MSINKVILIGRLTKDPELKYAATGTAVCNFSLALNEKYTDKNGQKQEKTEFLNIVIWGKQAEFSNQYLRKGREVYVEGRIQTRSYEKDGIKRYVTEINASTVQFLGGGNSDSKPVDKPVLKPQEDYRPALDTDFTADTIPF